MNRDKKAIQDQQAFPGNQWVMQIYKHCYTYKQAHKQTLKVWGYSHPSQKPTSQVITNPWRDLPLKIHTQTFTWQEKVLIKPSVLFKVKPNLQVKSLVRGKTNTHTQRKVLLLRGCSFITQETKCVISIPSITKQKCKIRTDFKRNILPVRYWADKQIAPPPKSCHWLSWCSPYWQMS